ncbi:hypothetical protein ECANGB1_988 [Enterospora canceri]|uniref:Uncharacterized protein n=1 Tax=Enterospora canceri TaxID=1081671 RepID=A0A1Y1S6Z1_9MICR|nr:hypothetical protein ECANGB1_988 [Enterospora canceri]
MEREYIRGLTEMVVERTKRHDTAMADLLEENRRLERLIAQKEDALLLEKEKAEKVAEKRIEPAENETEKMMKLHLKIKELEDENRRLTKTKMADELKLYRAMVKEKDERIRKQEMEIQRQKNEMEEYRNKSVEMRDVEKELKGDVMYEKSFLMHQTRLSPERSIRNNKGNMINIDGLFNVKMAKQKRLGKAKTSIKTVKENNKNVESKKVESILKKENKSYFKDLSFGNSSPIFDRKYMKGFK